LRRLCTRDADGNMVEISTKQRLERILDQTEMTCWLGCWHGMPQAKALRFSLSASRSARQEHQPRIHGSTELYVPVDRLRKGGFYRLKCVRSLFGQWEQALLPTPPPALSGSLKLEPTNTTDVIFSRCFREPSSSFHQTLGHPPILACHYHGASLLSAFSHSVPASSLPFHRYPRSRTSLACKFANFYVSLNTMWIPRMTCARMHKPRE
jgi:hypothetical protein